MSTATELPLRLLLISFVSKNSYVYYCPLFNKYIIWLSSLPGNLVCETLLTNSFLKSWRVKWTANSVSTVPGGFTNGNQVGYWRELSGKVYLITNVTMTVNPDSGKRATVFYQSINDSNTCSPWNKVFSREWIFVYINLWVVGLLIELLSVEFCIENFMFSQDDDIIKAVLKCVHVVYYMIIQPS